jgi:hypothetical protein
MTEKFIFEQTHFLYRSRITSQEVAEKVSQEKHNKLVD